MRTPTKIASTLFAVLAVNVGGAAFAAPTTAPSVTPSAVVSPEAKVTLDRMVAAYQPLNALAADGVVRVDFDVSGKTTQLDKPFTSTFMAPAAFKHQVTGDVQLGCTGLESYVFDEAKQQYSLAPVTATEGVTPLNALPASMKQALRLQNPSLALALSDDPMADLLGGVIKVDRIADQTIDGQACPSVLLTTDTGEITVAVDPSTSLMKRVAVDLASSLVRAGTPDVKKALFTVDYGTVSTGGTPTADAFAFTAPESAKDIEAFGKPSAQAMATQDPDAALAGKAAPAFSLLDLNDKTVTLAQHKGEVVILDFWATWCGPCVAALPSIDTLSKKFEGKGVTIYAVNVQETKAQVVAFRKKSGLSLPMLLDSDGKAMGDYRVGGIPQTVLIGKNGKVAKVWVGFSPDNEAKIEKAIKDELAR